MTAAAESASEAAQADAVALRAAGRVTYVLPHVELEGGLVAFEQDTTTFETERVLLGRDELAALRNERVEYAVDESVTPAWAFPEVGR